MTYWDDEEEARRRGVQLYSPNPDAPTSYGTGYTPEPPSLLSRAGTALGEMVPKTWQQAGLLAANFLPGTSTSELPDASGEFSDAHRRADPLGMATAGMKGANSLLGAIPIVGGITRTAQKAAKTVVKGSSVNLPSLRTLPIDEAIAIAREEPHLIKGGAGTEGLYVGGPREVQTRRQLTQNRRDFDERLAENPVGGDWYDRYRASVNEVTGGDPVQNEWMTHQHGQWSAGVSPEGELGFALKENNANVAGIPTKAGRPAPHQAQQAAIATGDPSEYLLGKKTGQYQSKITPDQVGPPTAVGVNDFRQARAFGYTDKAGLPQSEGLKGPQHNFVDYEMTLAVDRANKVKLGGRSDWTGEQLQAIPWVLQKGDDLYSRGKNVYRKQADAEIAKASRSGTPLTKEEKQLVYDKYEQQGRTEKLGEANKQIGDYFDKHEAYATHESRPGADTGHLPGLLGATPEQVMAYHADPASTWATAPGGRDAIYAGMQLPGTGVAVRTRPTTDMQGMYTPPGGVTEFNPGQVARPLVAFDNTPNAPKAMPQADRDILMAGETLRAVVDAQNAGAAHKPWVGGPVGKSNSVRLPMDRALAPEELQKIQAVSAAHGLPDVVDTGRGVTLTSFMDDPPKMTRETEGLLAAAASKALPDATQFRRAKIDSVYAGLADEDYNSLWKHGDRAGAPVTGALLDAVTKTPALRSALDNNPYLAERANAKLKRDAQSAHGAAREGIQNIRQIIGEGPGWIGRLEAAKKAGKIALPGLLAPLIGYTLSQEDDPSSAR